MRGHRRVIAFTRHDIQAVWRRVKTSASTARRASFRSSTATMTSCCAFTSAAVRTPPRRSSKERPRGTSGRIRWRSVRGLEGDARAARRLKVAVAELFVLLVIECLQRSGFVGLERPNRRAGDRSAVSSRCRRTPQLGTGALSSPPLGRSREQRRERRQGRRTRGPFSSSYPSSTRRKK